MCINSATPARSRERSPQSILFHADASDPDMRYFSRFNGFDPYLAFTAGGRKIGVGQSNEYGLRHLAKRYQISGFRVRPRFPADLFSALREAGVKITVDEDDSLFPERQCKTSAEVEALRSSGSARAWW